MNTWHCDGCHQDFEHDPTWTDEMIKEEALKNGLDPTGDNGLLCDDCYDNFLKWYKDER